MKRSSIFVVFASLSMMLTGCVVERCTPPQYATGVYTMAPPPPNVVYYEPWCGSTRFWHKVHQRIFDDGYSFNNDPLNHDVLGPVLGLDVYFPPAPLPYKQVD